MTELALIPPLSMVDDFVGLSGREYFMYLPELMTRPNYDRFIWRTGSKLCFNILDNGAFEGETLGPDELMDLAQAVQADEVVVPDVLGDGKATIEAIRNFERQTRSRRKSLREQRYMGVVQGATVRECVRCIISINNQFPFIRTLGLPKHLVRTVERTARVELAHYIRSMAGPLYDIHLLGTSPLWPDEIREMQEFNIRSMDTSMPFTFAHAIRRIDDGAGEFERPEAYFDLPKHEFDINLVSHNVHTLRSWCRGELPTDSNHF